jgi:glycosyltransferase involved in cell wall biosynthesis
MTTFPQRAVIANTAKKLRLAIVVSHPIQHFAPWYRELAKLPGLDLKLFYCCDWGAESYRDRDFGVDIKWDIPLLEGYEFDFLPITRRPKSKSFWGLDNPRVVDALNVFNPDVVKLYGYASRTNWRVARWTRTHRKPLMIYSDSNDRGAVPVWKRALKRAIVGYFYRHVDGAFYVGDNNFAYHARYGIPAQRLFYGMLPVDRSALLKAVPDMLETRASIRKELGIPQDAFVVLLCGKLTKGKRPMDLVEAVTQCVTDQYKIWALIVGDGPERATVQEYCKRHGVKDLRWTGFVNQTQIAKYYAAADCLAVTSEKDSHPLVITEAGTFGLPVVVSDSVGCIGPNDTARPGENAFIYPCGDLESLKKILVQLSSDRGVYQRAQAASLLISQGQDVTVAARQLLVAATELNRLGVRR